MGCRSSKPTENVKNATSPNVKSATSPDGEDMSAVVRVIGAKLDRTFDWTGKMDPYAKVFIGHGERRRELSITNTHYGGHKSPVWDHTSSAVDHNGNDSIEIVVLERDVLTSDTCGKAVSTMSDLFQASRLEQKRPTIGGTVQGDLQELPLFLHGERTGSVTVQICLIRKTPLDESSQTTVASDIFLQDIKPLGVSGGTACFFQLTLRNPRSNQCPDAYVAKDLSRAIDELQFYELARQFKGDEYSAMYPLLKFTFEYMGVLTAKIPGQCETQTKDLLVIQNLRAGCKKVRILDIKIGQKTAQGGWQGKSHVAAFRQALVDGLTNSASEGFRLEGFDNRPESLASQDAILEASFAKNSNYNNKLCKKSTRFLLQRLPAAEILAYFIDVHHETATDNDLNTVIAPIELAEIALHQIVIKLLELTVACRKCPVSQKWIGSSVALTLDVGAHVARNGSSEELIRKATHVCIFDWGRSELSTLRKHAVLSPQEQNDRSTFWRNYVGGIDKLLFEAAKCYRHTFGNARKWDQIQLKLWDFDTISSNDIIGKVSLQVVPTEKTTIKFDECKSANTKFTYSLEWKTFPSTSRLAGCWRLRIFNATDVPVADPFQRSTDAFIEVFARSTETGQVLRWSTAIKAQTLEPTWDEVFDLPVVRDDTQLEKGLHSVVPGLGGACPEVPLHECLYPEWQLDKNQRITEEKKSKLYSAWQANLKHSSSPEVVVQSVTDAMVVPPKRSKLVEDMSPAFQAERGIGESGDVADGEGCKSNPNAKFKAERGIGESGDVADGEGCKSNPNAKSNAERGIGENGAVADEAWSTSPPIYRKKNSIVEEEYSINDGCCRSRCWSGSSGSFSM